MESIWERSCAIPRREALRGDLEVDTAVIGAGITGVLAAFYLQQAGRRVAVLEAGRIAGGQTRGTTAKITAQHGMIYRHLLETMGEEKAAQYAAANQAAVDEYEALIRRRGIDCDFSRQNAYLYGGDLELLTREAEAAHKLGLPASLVRQLPVPLPAAGAVMFAEQAQFHPLKFIRALAGELSIFEDTPVQAVEDDTLRTPGGTVRAKTVVFACHFPFVNLPGMYFMRMYQQRSYLLALENAPAFEGMYIGAGENNISLRCHDGLVLLGGAGHRAGENRRGGRYDLLRQTAQEWFPGSREVACWSAQDCIPADGVPYIGQYAASRPDWYVATGFQKWGMSTAMAAAILLRDLICTGDSPFAGVFDPGRMDLESAAGAAAQGGQAVKGLARRFFQIPSTAAQSIPAGHGGVVQLDGEKVGVYKEPDGTLHAVDIRCPHLGCQLEWNPDEHSWDCPCHGSRFDCFGRLLSGPAREDAVYE